MATLRPKRLGILGGMSWVSSLKYYELINLEIIKLTGGAHAADLVLWSFDTTQIEQYILSSNWRAIGRLLQDGANKLLNCEVEAILIASNTIHRVVEQKLLSIAVPLIHIRDSLLREIIRHNFSKVGFIGTAATMKGDLYTNLINGSSGVAVVLPPEQSWAKIDEIIFDRLCRGVVDSSDREFMTSIVRNFQYDNVHCVVLGCTELGELHLQFPKLLFLDTTEIHALDAARWSASSNQGVRAQRKKVL